MDMFDIKKEYWFTIEPYVYTTFAGNSALLYNTLDGVAIEISDSELIDLTRQVYEKENNGMALLKGEQLKNPQILSFITNLRDKFMGDIVDTSLSSGKPIQLTPLLNIQSEVSRLKKSPDNSVGKNLMKYLREVVLDFTDSDSIPTNAFIRFVSQIAGVVKIQLIDIWNFSKAEELLLVLSDFRPHKEIITSYRKITEEKLNQIPKGNFSLKTVVDFPFDNQQWEKSEKWVLNKNIPVKFEFAVSSEQDYEVAEQIIEKYKLENCQIHPVFTGNNLSFFEENIYLSQEDILATPLSMREIFANQALSTSDFGKITIKSNGDVHANVHDPALGNIATHTIQEMLYKEMDEGCSWLRIRNQAPCNNCMYQWLCPSPSEYEMAIGKPNLCHVKP
jgi:pseudo-rSAM protein